MKPPSHILSADVNADYALQHSDPPSVTLHDVTTGGRAAVVPKWFRFAVTSFTADREMCAWQKFHKLTCCISGNSGVTEPRTCCNVC